MSAEEKRVANLDRRVVSICILPNSEVRIEEKAKKE
jgi:hypothetical protein